MSELQEGTAATNPNAKNQKIAVLGGGVMGETVLAGILAAGWPGEQVVLSERRAEVAQRISERHGVIIGDSNTQTVSGADVVVLAVKPQDVGGILEEIASELAPTALVISVAAGRSEEHTSELQSRGHLVCRLLLEKKKV